MKARVYPFSSCRMVSRLLWSESESLRIPKHSTYYQDCVQNFVEIPKNVAAAPYRARFQTITETENAFFVCRPRCVHSSVTLSGASCAYWLKISFSFVGQGVPGAHRMPASSASVEGFGFVCVGSAAREWGQTKAIAITLDSWAYRKVGTAVASLRQGIATLAKTHFVVGFGKGLHQILCYISK